MNGRATATSSRARATFCRLLLLSAAILVGGSAELHADWIDDWAYAAPSSPYYFEVNRLGSGPIIHPGLSPSIGDNINGPSLIRAPEWLADPLGNYYLYFAHHSGSYIRMAYADSLTGPWTIHEGGVLSLDDVFGRGHIASPDVHVDHDLQRIRMYYHQPVQPGSGLTGQMTWAALSGDGVAFQPQPEILGRFYFRVFEHDGWHYALAKDGPDGGIIYRSADGLSNFEQGPRILPNARHLALWRRDNALYVFFSRVGDAPEHILVSRVENLYDDWHDWTYTEPQSVLLPQFDFEGANLPIASSVSGAATGPLHELRDPAIFEENGRLYLLYSTAGESGIAIAELNFVPEPGGPLFFMAAAAGLAYSRRRWQAARLDRTKRISPHLPG